MLYDNIDTTNTMQEIPFPLKREVWYNPEKPIIIFTVDYSKVMEQLKTYNSNG